MTMPAHCLNCDRPICAKRTPPEQRAGRLLHAARGLCHTCHRDGAIRGRTAPLREDLPQDTTPEGVARCRSELAVYLRQRRQRAATAAPAPRSAMALLARAHAAGVRHIKHPAPTS